jgi:hypothetical protein
VKVGMMAYIYGGEIVMTRKAIIGERNSRKD